MATLKKRTHLTGKQDVAKLKPETLELIKVRQALILQHKVTISALEEASNSAVLEETGLDARVEHIELDLETGEVKRA